MSSPVIPGFFVRHKDVKFPRSYFLEAWLVYKVGQSKSISVAILVLEYSLVLRVSMLEEFAWRDIAVAFSLMLVLEGIIPFLCPDRWKNLVQTLAEVDSKTMRIMGFFSMLIGTALLYWVR